jgi:hypothetical protein
MSAANADDSLSLSQLSRLDEVCDRFEACWKAGEPPQIEDYLDADRQPYHPELLRELLLLDVEYRTRAGEDPSAAQYKARFPQYAELVEEAFRRISAGWEPERNRGDPSSPRILLEVIGGPHKGRRFDFTGHENFIVGRSRCAHFRLSAEDPFFSRFHFMVEVNPPRCRLVDLISLNGTKVNGRPVEVTDLRDGDEIRGGETVLRVSLAGLGTTAPEEAQPPPGRPPVDTTVSLRAAGPAEFGQGPADDQPPAPPPAVPGFELVRELGGGGMGMVYLVRRTADGVLLALKTIRPPFAATQREVQRFLRECQILCTLRHPNIVAFHERGRVGEMFYFIMDYVPGTDARRLVESHGRLPIARAVGLVCQILRALDYAHRRGFVHRDVKPANLLVSREQGREVCRLADFGLARVYHESRMSGLTVLGDMGGTLPYMAPEQITNYRDACPAADQYSAAATLYYLSTGRFLYDFDKDRLEQQLKQILDESPVPIRHRRPEIPECLAAVIHQALAKDPGKRFPDAAALHDALLPFGSLGSGSPPGSLA